jgi:Protein of unknwon function (DUF3310)
MRKFLKELALTRQVNGDHYLKRKIQPIEYIYANGLDFLEGCIVKRITRWRYKDGFEDLEKIKHEVDLLIALHNSPETDYGNTRREVEETAQTSQSFGEGFANTKVQTAYQALQELFPKHEWEKLVSWGGYRWVRRGVLLYPDYILLRVGNMKKIIDPPSGWRYGFPKVLPDYSVDLRSWLIENGYPEVDADFAVQHSRSWYKEENGDG